MAAPMVGAGGAGVGVQLVLGGSVTLSLFARLRPENGL